MSILISGYSIKAPKSRNTLEFYNNLKDKIDMTSETKRYPKGYLSLPPKTGTLEDVDKFDHHHFKYNIKQVEKMDISIRLLLEVTNEALMDARLSLNQLRGSNTGVYLGHCFSDYLGQIKNDSNVNGYELVNSCPSMASGKISYFYDLKGPSLVFDTACSSSLIALEKAFQDINSGIVDRAIVGGISITIDPKTNHLFNSFKMLSPTGTCYVFDERANGYCRSEGIGVIIIESERVRNYGYAKIEGIMTNSDGFTSKGITYPSWEAQSKVAKDTLKRFNIDKSKIKYIEAHGTGTVVGDREELKSLSEIYQGLSNISIGSIKSNLGHTEGASGIMSIIKCLLMYENKKIFPNLNYKSTSHDQLLNGQFKVVTELKDLPDESFISISNYGFTGTNAFLVLSPGNVNFNHTNINNKIKFSNLNTDNLVDKSNKFIKQNILLGNENYFKYIQVNNEWKYNKKADPVFLFSGQGSQFKNMGKDLLNSSVIFKNTIDRLSNLIDYDLVDLFNKGDKWFDKNYSPIGIISYQIGLINIMNELGINPKFILGHSLGEISACYAAGLINEEQAIKITNVRCKLVNMLDANLSILVTPYDKDMNLITSYQNKYIYFVNNDYNCIENEELIPMKGQMIFVPEEKSMIEDVIQKNNLNQIRIACYNNPKGYTISGTEKQIDKFRSKMLEINNKLRISDINTDNIAYHSPMLKFFENLLDDEFKSILGESEKNLSKK